MKDLWTLLISASNNVTGIPDAFLKAKKQQILQEKVNKKIKILDRKGTNQN